MTTDDEKTKGAGTGAAGSTTTARKAAGRSKASAASGTAPAKTARAVRDAASAGAGAEKPARAAAAPRIGTVAAKAAAGSAGAPATRKPAARGKPMVAGAGDVLASGKTVPARPAGPALRRKELVERVAKASGLKKKQVRPVVEATLAALGAAIEAGETLALPPFGKARVNRHKDFGTGELLTVKLRRGTGGRGTKKSAAPLAEDAE